MAGVSIAERVRGFLKPRQDNFAIDNLLIIGGKLLTIETIQTQLKENHGRANLKEIKKCAEEDAVKFEGVVKIGNEKKASEIRFIDRAFAFGIPSATLVAVAAAKLLNWI